MSQQPGMNIIMGHIEYQYFYFVGEMLFTGLGSFTTTE